MAAVLSDAVLKAAQQFIAWDPNAETRGQVEAVLKAAQAGDAAAVKSCGSMFGSHLEFGTAGLRGEMAPGFNRMNDLTVLQAAQGIADYVAAAHEAAGPAEDAEPPVVVIGYDHRARGSLNSRRFAVLTAAAMTHRGMRVRLFSSFACTPLVPFAVRHFGAAAGIMVTASHNPKQDNGYKVYAANGAQIISPVDREIAARIAAPENQEPWSHLDLLTPTELSGLRSRDDGATHEATGVPPVATAYALPTDLLLERLREVRGEEDALPGYSAPIDAGVTAAYVAASVAGQCRHAAANAAPGGVRIAYTAMHGVGRPFAQAMAAAFGLPPYVETPRQVQPDATFPTVDYPNPEEGKGALALAMETANAAGCTLILANDPDADRLAVATWVPAPTGDAAPGSAGGEWRVLSGNEIGALLGAWAWHKWRAEGRDGKGAWMAVSAVSSKLLRAMAAAEGFGFREVLTGFKWHGNAMAQAEAAGEKVIFAFEEAIGFSCGDVVRDKDGVVAAAVFAEMAQWLARERGQTVSQRLAEIYDKYGHFVSNNGYVFVDDPAKSATIFARLRNGGKYWARLPPAVGPAAGGASGRSGLAIVGVRDLTATADCPGGWDSAQAPSCAPALPVSSSGNMVTFTFGNGAEVTLRTSGTEPKLKWYSELARGDPAEARAELAATVAAVLDHMLQPEAHGLARPAAK